MKQLTETYIIKKFMEDKGFEIMDFMFSKAQENLTIPMPWDDPRRKPSVISDRGLILISGVPPYQEENKIIIRFDAPHSKYVEYGTGPHPVPIKPLETWVRRKLKIKKPQEARNIAFAISKKISKEGLPPHPFIRPAIEEAKRRYNLKNITVI